MTDRQVFIEYMGQVARGNIEPPACTLCEAILLFYVDEDDRVYWRCTGCDTMSYPGTAEIRAMEQAIRQV